MYEYRATITDVYDGDTITASIDLGFNSCLSKVKFRLYGIDAPEVRGAERPQGIVTRDWLREQVLGKDVILRSIKDRKGKYGRWLAQIYIGERDIIREMVEAGLAEWRDY